jgi:predicted xylose isomerase-like sugar epimerase
MKILNAYQITITPAAAALFNTANHLGLRAGDIRNSQAHNKLYARMENRSLDQAADELGIHRDDIAAIYNLHRNLPLPAGAFRIRSAK